MDKILITFLSFIFIVVCLVVGVIVIVDSKARNFESCVAATYNVAGCEKELYPERYKDRVQKEEYYRKRVPLVRVR